MGTGPSLNAISPAKFVRDRNCNVAWDPIKNTDIYNYLTHNEIKEADDRALQIAEPTVCAEKLIDALCKGSRNDISSVRSIYTWICNNIRYDPTSKCVDVSSILNTRRCTSTGFVCLFEEMCSLRNISVIRLTSYVKSLSFVLDLDDMEDKHNLHVWNAVFVNNKYHFVDCTWGAATASESVENIEHFFFTPPNNVGIYC